MSQAQRFVSRPTSVIATLLVLLLTTAACAQTATPASSPSAAAAASKSAAAPTAATSAPSPTPVALENVKLIVPVAGSLVDLQVHLALANKIFEANGLKVEYSAASGGGPDIQALINKNVEFDYATPSQAVIAQSQGQDIVSVYMGNVRPVGDVVLRKSVADRLGITEKTPLAQRIAALNGLKVGVSTAGGFFAQEAQWFIKKYNLKNVEIVPTGGQATAIAAFKQGTVDATIYSPPGIVQMKAMDGIWLIRPSQGEIKEMDGFLQSGLLVRRDYLQSKTDTVKRMIKSFLTSAEYIRSHSAEDLAKIVKPIMGNMDDAILLESIKFIQALTTKDGCMSETGFNTVQDFLLIANAIKQPVPFKQVMNNDYLPTKCG